jgi:hypothetical protein
MFPLWDEIPTKKIPFITILIIYLIVWYITIKLSYLRMLRPLSTPMV